MSTRVSKQQRSVLIIVENLPVPLDRRVWIEARTLSAAGYQVIVCCPRSDKHPEPYEFLENIHIYRHPYPTEGVGLWGYLVEYSSALFWQFLLAFRILFKHGFDVIQACNPPDTIFIVGGFFKYVFGKKFIFDHHDLSPELYEAKFQKKGPLHRILLKLERLTFRTADVVITTNDSFRRIAETRGSVPPDRIFIVRSGPDLNRFRLEAPVESWRKGRKHMVSYLGVMNDQDGIDYLLEAVSHIVKERKREDVQFVLMGSGPELENLQRQASDLGVDDYVTFTGWVNDQVIVPVLNTADVAVCPDPYNTLNDKLTMNKVMEYMALGKPIVQYDLTESRYSAGDAAVYAKRNCAIDLGDKILGLLDDPESRAAMGKLGRRRIETVLAWEHQAPVFLSAYEALGWPSGISVTEGKRQTDPIA